MLAQNKKIVLGILGGLFCFNLLAWIAVYDLSGQKFLEVTFFDIGQGDAILIETPQGHQVLIDGGPGSTILGKLADEMPFWDRTIDLIILSHPEADHLTGFLKILRRYKVENILWTGVKRNTAAFEEWQKLIEEERIKEGAEIKIAQAGQKINLSKRFPCYFEILYPFEDLSGKEFTDSNNTSIVIRLVYGNNSFLFTGDAYQSVETEILEKGTNVDSDILKISHHGSKTSSGEKFIAGVSPAVAIISAGKNNSYNHPHQETLEILQKYDIDILRTDIDGDIKIISDSKNYGISTF